MLKVSLQLLVYTLLEDAQETDIDKHKNEASCPGRCFFFRSLNFVNFLCAFSNTAMWYYKYKTRIYYGTQIFNTDVPMCFGLARFHVYLYRSSACLPEI
jgi:hypothetical protein